MPVITSEAVAFATPESAVLSALVHHSGPQALQIAQSALRAAARAGVNQRALYTESILRMAKGAHRYALEEVMNQLRIPKNYSWLYKPMQQFTAENREEARAEGEAFGAAKGKAEGKAKGKAEGEVSGRVATLLSILRAKGFALSQQKRQQIESRHDVERVDRWILAAVNAGASDDVFAED